MTRRLRGLVLAGGLLLVGGTGARGEDAGPAGEAAPLEGRLYPVRALTRRVLPARPDVGPWTVLSEFVNDEETPLFGQDPEGESLVPSDCAADLVEFVKASVGPPGTWEREGVRIGTLGEEYLLVRHTPAVHAGVADVLAAEARRISTEVAVDVAILSGDVGPEGTPFDLRRAIATGAVRALAFGRAVVPPWAGTLLRGGSVRAFLQDADAEVAQDARVTDPIVGLVPEGLACEVEATAVTAGRATVRVRGWWAGPPTFSTYRTTEGDVLELPATPGRRFEATTDLDAGAWSRLPLGGGTFLALRAGIRPFGIGSADAAGEILGSPSSDVRPGPRRRREFDVAPLLERVEMSRAPALQIWGSGYTPPEPPEVPEDTPVFPLDSEFIDLVKEFVDPVSWEEEGAVLAFRGGRLVARHDERRLEALEGLLRRLREAHARTTRVRVALVSLPAASLPELWTGLDDALVADGGGALLARAGARRVDVVEMGLRDGQRKGTFSGTTRSYLADFDVEIAPSSTIANPVVRQVWEGTSLDVTATPVLSGSALALDLRVEQGVVREMRRAATSHGPVECPVYDRLRYVGSLTVRSGTTTIAAATPAGGEVTLLLVSAVRE